jgi:glutamate-1-semialdehyde 2,1-aminomutase
MSVAIDRTKLAGLLAAESDTFVRTHPRSAELHRRASASLVAGVPMNWMTRWPGAFPVFAERASGASVTDVDGHTYVDLCLGDTGAMAGHSPPATVEAVAQRAGQGITMMLPTEDAIWAGEELTRRFGLPHWQIAMTATDANRFVIRMARHATGRQRILVMNWCYHGTVDEALWVLDEGGAVVPRPGNVGPLDATGDAVAVVEFNDLEALERELSRGDVAMVLAEPALTNIGIVLPDDGYHAELRRLARAHGTLLCIDETHTICVGPGGATAAWGLEPDLLTIGKPIAGGVPIAAYGMSDELADRLAEPVFGEHSDVSGVGGTLSGNALALAALRATLSTTLTAEDYARMVPLAQQWTEGVAGAIARAGLPWHVQQLGCRAEYWFCPPPRNGGQAAAALDADLEAYFHLYALNRGVLLTPFHNMALMSPATTVDDVARHTEVFEGAVTSLLSAGTTPRSSSSVTGGGAGRGAGE